MAKTEKVCTVCGAIFIGGAGAMYCPTCKRTRKTEMERERYKNGSKRKVGSTDICEKCGAEYTVESPRQKYCDSCKPVTHHAKKQPPEIEIVPTKRKRAPSKPREIECAVCGNSFYSAGSRATYCPDCRADRKALYRERQNEKRILAGRKSIGMENECANCGAKFIVEKKNQKFCTDCREKLNFPQKSSVIGVFWARKQRLWVANCNGKTLGKFTSEEDAIKARKDAERDIEKRYCVVCGKELSITRGYYHAMTCSDKCRAEYRRIYNDVGHRNEKRGNAQYVSLYVEVPVETKSRLFAEVRARKCTISKYIRDLIQKEFDALDKERNDKSE